MLSFDYESKEAETDMAWLLVIDGMKIWLPKSRCYQDEHTMIVEVPEWLAEEKGLA